MKKTRFKILFYILIVLFSVVSFMASPYSLADERDQSINITSERMEVERDKRLITFVGNVVAVKENMTIYSDELRIYYNKEGKETNKIIATGNVRIEQEQRTATANRAEYNRIKETIVLTGNPRVKECQNIVEGEIITVYLIDGRSVIEGSDNKKVKAVLLPDNGRESKKGCL